MAVKFYDGKSVSLVTIEEQRNQRLENSMALVLVVCKKTFWRFGNAQSGFFQIERIHKVIFRWTGGFTSLFLFKPNLTLETGQDC